MPVGSRTSARVATATLLTALGCQPRTIDHGDRPFDEVAATVSGGIVPGTGGGDTGEPFDDALGNYPEPAVTACGDVLGDLPAIDGLTSAWAVIAVPGAFMGSESLETGSVLLRISDDVIRECGEAPADEDDFMTTGFFGSSTGLFGTGTGFDPTSGGNDSDPSGGGDSTDGYAGNGRSFELLLGPDELTVGVHPIDTLNNPSVRLYGEGATETFGSEASLELLRVDDACIIGVLRGFESDAGFPFMEGGFVAQTCQRQCFPVDGVEC